MRCEQLSVEEALYQGSALPHAYIRSLSTVTLGVTPEKISTDELMEARFFSSEEEIRVFKADDILQAVRLVMESSDRAIVETYVLDNRKFGEKVSVRHTLASDEDGQTYITETCLVGWEVE